MHTYLMGARNDQERFLYADPSRRFERMEELLPPVIGLRKVLGEQIRRQQSIGLAEDLTRLQGAEARFDVVFTWAAAGFNDTLLR